MSKHNDPYLISCFFFVFFFLLLFYLVYLWFNRPKHLVHLFNAKHMEKCQSSRVILNHIISYQVLLKIAR